MLLINHQLLRGDDGEVSSEDGGQRVHPCLYRASSVRIPKSHHNQPIVLNHPYRGIMSTHVQDSHAFHGISLHVNITVAPENVDKFLAAFKTCFDAVTAEPECTFFEVFHDVDNPGDFRFVENWSKDKE